MNPSPYKEAVKIYWYDPNNGWTQNNTIIKRILKLVSREEFMKQEEKCDPKDRELWNRVGYPAIEIAPGGMCTCIYNKTHIFIYKNMVNEATLI